MKTLIVYGTKHGATKKCADMLKEELTGEVTLVNLTESSVAELEKYDQIIMGGSIYAGRINKEVKKFCSQYLDLLESKKTGIFICSGIEEDWKDNLNNSFPEELIEKSVTGYFGGEIDLDKLNFLVRFAVKKLMGDGPKPEILEENIKEFAAEFN